MTPRVPTDRRRKAPQYRLRIRFVPAPKGHDFDSGFEALAAIGRRSLAAKGAK